ncbi:DMT family transporter [Mameliella sediminis]|uniref:DMT family transporter n=1 Tax=Mameliella sediminis TaxID=2836866 RepID=UPI001C47414D|nr:DMT family transporter [Mameliella sediminis]MBV7395798.1 DMT family transporter [Mameliella sediminis]
MDLWIIATLLAATFQTARFMLHKVLANTGLSATGSTFARFAYAMPAAALVLVIYLSATGQVLPAMDPGFWIWAIVGGLGQILATVLVVLCFQERNFAVGITFKKTEVIQTALLGVVVLGEAISPAGWVAIAIGLAGVLLLSKTPDAAGLWKGLSSRAVVLGVGSGFFFAVAGVGYRATTLELPTEDPVLRAAVSLVAVTLLQSTGLAIWLRWREPGQLRAVWDARRRAVWLGLTSMAGTMGWFTAFTLQTAAYVYALGQVELILSLAASVLFFREKVTARELAGIGVLMVSIVVLVLVL